MAKRPCTTEVDRPGVLYQSEEVEILEEDELSSKARSTLSEIDKKQKDKREKKKGIFNVDRQLITTTLKPNREKDEIAAAEATLVYHGVSHGISYLAQQCTTTVLKNLFSSLSIASSLSCGRTKAAAIATDVLAPYFTHHVIQEMKLAFYYSLSLDASNKGNLKTYPFCVQYFSDVVIIDFIDDSSESAIDIHRNARQILDKYELNLYGLTAIGADNTNVNMGEYHSVFALFRDEKPTLLKGNPIYTVLRLEHVG
ncbi:unnamed protein product [Rotaria magnacalcarata]|uniref:Uncharacterized protein n=1 Tax=Rotaria magnacalcarata TaxID=392030 RepID=A0A815IU19_9BILA|nr:unnamed protein product [Rotaria magnacalcarata]CAF4754320.1 unnamed protein product [Rotaria magnacalcarata]